MGWLPPSPKLRPRRERLGRRRARFKPITELLDRRELLAAFSLIETASAGLAGITTAADGSIWFAEGDANKLGRIVPGASTAPAEVVLPDASRPAGIAVGPDGAIWVTLPGTNSVARVSPTGPPTVSPFEIPTADAVPAGITAGPGNALWFAQSGLDSIGSVPTAGPVSGEAVDVGDGPTAVAYSPSAGLWAAVTDADKIVRIDPAAGTVIDTRTFDPGSKPSGLAVGPGGELWVALSGTNRIARVNPGAGGSQVLYPLPAGSSAALAIASGADGAIWFTEPGAGRVGRITTAGQITEFAAPADAGTLNQITAAPSGLWMTTSTGNRIVRLDPSQLTTVTGQPISVKNGVVAPQVVATFTSAAVAPAVSDFTALISWGDGSPPSTGVVAPAAGGGFQVTASHEYTSAGSFPVTVTVADSAGDATTSSAVVATVESPSVALSYRLSATSDSGRSNSDQVTNVSRPVFIGDANPNAIVQIYATRAGSWPTETRYLGQAIANQDGDWTLWSTFLPDGAYTITATQTPPAGSPSAAVPLARPLVIDTVGPRVAGLAYDAATNHVTVVIGDGGSGVDMATSADPNNYTVVPPRTIIGAHPAGGRPQGPIVAAGISGFYTTADSYTVQLDFGAAVMARARRGRYMFQVASGGVADLAGNALDGEFYGALPSGDGVSGGNFIARLNVSKPRAPRRPVMRRGLRHV